jgi:hypothetical protein
LTGAAGHIAAESGGDGELDWLRHWERPHCVD